MNAFGQIPVYIQNTVCLWAFVVLLAGVADSILLWRQRRYRLLAATAWGCTTAFLMFHLCRDLTEWRLHGRGKVISLAAAQLPAVAWLAILFGLSVMMFMSYVSIRRWRRIHITEGSIKESMDELPAGVCYYLEDGRCILVNHRMYDIVLACTGKKLQNAVAFYEEIRDRKIQLLSDGTIVAFRHRRLRYRGMEIREMIADDVTEWYEKSEQLRKENERVRQLGEAMRTYGRTIDETVRRREILQAKINIHDEMNRLIFATRNEVTPQILKEWQSNALLLCREAHRQRSGSGFRSVVKDLETLADTIGIRIEWEGEPSQRDQDTLKVLLDAGREAMVNAVKHARAGVLFVRFDGHDRILFTNDGVPPQSDEVKETGGLAGLRRRITETGGNMIVEAKPVFCLTVELGNRQTVENKTAEEKLCHTEC